MPARGKAEKADAVRVEAEVPRAAAHQAHGALRILQGHNGALGVALARQTVDEHESADPARRQPTRRLEALLVQHVADVAAARAR